MSAIDDLINRFEAGATLLPYAIAGLTPEQLAARPGPGAWSIGELVVHLLDSDLVGADRMKRVMSEENPTLLAYDQDAWISRLGAAEMPIQEAVEIFAANRRWMSRLLRRCSETDFARSGVHSSDGPLSLAKLVARYVGHVDNHLKFLYGKRANLGVSVYPKYSYPTD